MKEIPLLCFFVIVLRKIGCIQDSLNTISIAGNVCFPHISEMIFKNIMNNTEVNHPIDLQYLNSILCSSGDFFLE